MFNFCENPPIRSRVLICGRTHRQTDMMKRILPFRKFEQSTLKTGIHGILYFVCFHFLYKFAQNISQSKKNLERYDHKRIIVFTCRIRYAFQISMKLEFSQ